MLICCSGGFGLVVLICTDRGLLASCYFFLFIPSHNYFRYFILINMVLAIIVDAFKDASEVQTVHDVSLMTTFAETVKYFYQSLLSSRSSYKKHRKSVLPATTPHTDVEAGGSDVKAECNEAQAENSSEKGRGGKEVESGNNKKEQDDVLIRIPVANSK